MTLSKSLKFNKNSNSNATAIALEYDICPYCKSVNSLVIDGETGNIVCEKCGSIIDNYFTFFANYNVVKNRSEKKIESYPAEPLKQSKTIPSIEAVLSEFYGKFIEIVHEKYKKYVQYLNEFGDWLFNTGVNVILMKCGKSWFKLHCSNSPIGKIYFRAYCVGMLRRGNVDLLLNLFGAWLVTYKGFTIWKVYKKDKLTSSKVVVWIKAISEYLKKHST